jgi:hypothetical protein
MAKYIDITGKRYNKLTVLKRISSKAPHRWECLCDCGNVITTTTSCLNSGNTTTCGCSRSARPVVYSISESNCWICTSHPRDKDGYPQICVNRNKARLSRVYYEKYRGPIPKGICVCHTCDTPECINPDHLFLGTNEENTRDKYEKGRSARGENNGFSKLTREQVIEIRSSPEPQREIAKKYGMTVSGIQCVLYRRNWKHVV